MIGGVVFRSARRAAAVSILDARDGVTANHRAVHDPWLDRVPVEPVHTLVEEVDRCQPGWIGIHTRREGLQTFPAAVVVSTGEAPAVHAVVLIFPPPESLHVTPGGLGTVGGSGGGGTQ